MVPESKGQFQISFIRWKLMHFYTNVIRISTQTSNQYKFTNGLDNGLSPVQRQAINGTNDGFISTNDILVYWRNYVTRLRWVNEMTHVKWYLCRCTKIFRKQIHDPMNIEIDKHLFDILYRLEKQFHTECTCCKLHVRVRHLWHVVWTYNMSLLQQMSPRKLCISITSESMRV